MKAKSNSNSAVWENKNHSLFRDTYDLLGATEISPHHWILQTRLNHEDLASIWLALGCDFLAAGLLVGLDFFPVRSRRYGLSIVSSERLDLIAVNGHWMLHEKEIQREPCPVLILAGVPGSGKSAVLAELCKLFTIPKQHILTSRKRRRIDPDFNAGNLNSLDDLKTTEYRRNPSFALPVLFRGEKYYFKLASLIDRFDPINTLLVFVDSHFARVRWRLKLMPDIKLVWLETSATVIESRLRSRSTIGSEAVSKNYLSYCEPTKEAANLIIDTDNQTPKEIAETIKKFIEP